MIGPILVYSLLAMTMIIACYCQWIVHNGLIDTDRAGYDRLIVALVVGCIVSGAMIGLGLSLGTVPYWPLGVIVGLAFAFRLTHPSHQVKEDGNR
jgi:hypothetical protein